MQHVAAPVDPLVGGPPLLAPVMPLKAQPSWSPLDALPPLPPLPAPSAYLGGGYEGEGGLPAALPLPGGFSPYGGGGGGGLPYAGAAPPLPLGPPPQGLPYAGAAAASAAAAPPLPLGPPPLQSALPYAAGAPPMGGSPPSPFSTPPPPPPHAVPAAPLDPQQLQAEAAALNAALNLLLHGPPPPAPLIGYDIVADANFASAVAVAMQALPSRLIRPAALFTLLANHLTPPAVVYSAYSDVYFLYHVLRVQGVSPCVMPGQGTLLQWNPPLPPQPQLLPPPPPPLPLPLPLPLPRAPPPPPPAAADVLAVLGVLDAAVAAGGAPAAAAVEALVSAGVLGGAGLRAAGVPAALLPHLAAALGGVGAGAGAAGGVALPAAGAAGRGRGSAGGTAAALAAGGGSAARAGGAGGSGTVWGKVGSGGGAAMAAVQQAQLLRQQAQAQAHFPVLGAAAAGAAAAGASSASVSGRRSSGRPSDASESSTLPLASGAAGGGSGSASSASGGSASGGSGGSGGGGGASEKRTPLPRKVAALLGRGGDWSCGACEHLNFTGRVACQSCGGPAPAPGSPPAVAKVRRLCVSHDGAASVAELIKWFSAYGPLADKVVDRGTYAFIEFVNVEDAKAAQEGETGRRLSNGRFLITMPAKARQNAKGGAGARR